MIDQTIFNRRMPPTIQDVKIYFSQKGVSEPEAEVFFLFQEKRQWATRKGRSLQEWKRTARRWIAAIMQNQPLLFEQTVH
jgi:hypothetical protein